MFAKEKCTSSVREVIHAKETIIIVTGTHSYEWNITVIEQSNVKQLSFPNRILALKELRKLKKQVKIIGKCILGIF